MELTSIAYVRGGGWLRVGFGGGGGLGGGYDWMWQRPGKEATILLNKLAFCLAVPTQHSGQNLQCLQQALLLRWALYTLLS